MFLIHLCINRNKLQSFKTKGGKSVNEWLIAYALLPTKFLCDLNMDEKGGIMIEYSENWNSSHLIKTFLSACQCFERNNPGLRMAYSNDLCRFVIVNSPHLKKSQELYNVAYNTDLTTKLLNTKEIEGTYLERIVLINNSTMRVDIGFGNGKVNNSIDSEKNLYNYVVNKNGKVCYYDLYNERSYEYYDKADLARLDYFENRSVFDKSIDEITNFNHMNPNPDNVIYRYYDPRDDKLTMNNQRFKFLSFNYNNAPNLNDILYNNCSRGNWVNIQNRIQNALERYSFVFCFFTDNSYQNLCIVGWNTLSQMNSVYQYLLLTTKTNNYPIVANQIVKTSYDVNPVELQMLSRNVFDRYLKMYSIDHFSEFRYKVYYLDNPNIPLEVYQAPIQWNVRELTKPLILTSNHPYPDTLLETKTIKQANIRFALDFKNMTGMNDEAQLKIIGNAPYNDQTKYQKIFGPFFDKLRINILQDIQNIVNRNYANPNLFTNLPAPNQQNYQQQVVLNANQIHCVENGITCWMLN